MAVSIEVQLFELEKGFWTEGEGYYDSHLAEDAVMVFSSPVGLLDREAVVASLRGVPRWAEVSFTEQHLLRLAPDVAALIYHAEARREDAEPYRAHCSSVYVVRNRTWQLAMHQQTPASG
jgi:hypothetical protein